LLAVTGRRRLDKTTLLAHWAQASGDLNITLTTTADLLGFRPFEVAEPLTIPAGVQVRRRNV
jgi:hypothetical protein